MSPLVVAIFPLSIVIAGVIAIFRARACDRIFYPFLILIWLASVNEILSIVLSSLGTTVNVNNNVYVLAESLLILWFFRRLGTIASFGLATILGIAFVIFWLTENFVISSLRYVNSWFRIFYSFVVVILSVTAVNRLIVTETKALSKLPVFIITTGFIVYFTYKILVEAFWIYGLNNSTEFRGRVYLIMEWLNMLVNLLFALAVLWIPRKREYTLLF